MYSNAGGIGWLSGNGSKCRGWRWPLKFRRVTTLSKDQTIHVRIASVDAPEISVVTLPPPFLPGWSLSLEMLRAGTGLTYEQAGAEYGKYGKDEFLRVETEARAARRGMRKDGTAGETPAQYKRRPQAEANLDADCLLIDRTRWSCPVPSRLSAAK
ncbi:uncharacterized protein EDB91DRAFT_1333888 [Suillus paluster]|uniref:uncharacterized protein n=1 Tax=Suillus paluster TaxID=48578 RepID=UPI001B88738F|nr:uncharacterized protein EDB91DRAFT_1333888 [Suillus paluster]KAG1750365.1 hypothetical protein EDB91DRAFT_1333888 [Suillus paluster]